MFAFLGTAAFAGYTIYAPRIPAPSPLWTVSWGMLFTAIVVGLVGIGDASSWSVRSVPMVVVFAILFSGGLSLALNYALYVWSLQRIGSAQAAVYLNLVPVFAVMAAIVFLGEEWTFRQWLGGPLAVLGVYLVRRPQILN